MVQNEDYETAAQKLVNEGFSRTVPDRKPNAAVLARDPDPKALIAKINAGFGTLDKATQNFEYPGSKKRLVLVPNSFAQLPIETSGSKLQSSKYDTFENVFFPLEAALIESFARCAVRETGSAMTLWQSTLRGWISTSLTYLDIEDDILDACQQKEAVEWYSSNYGRDYHTQNGPTDYRVSKLIGSGKYVSVDSRGRAL